MATLKGPLRQGPWRRLILLGVLALVMLLTAPAIAYHWAYGQRVLVGVRVVDLDLGGHGEVQAREMVREWYQSREKSTLVLRHESREWATTLAEMGFTVDVERSAEAALAVGRVGALPYQWWTSLTALWQGHQVEPVLFLDQEVARRVLAQVASEIDRAPRDAQVLVDEQGLVRIQGAASGRALNLADNLSRLTTLSATADSFELTVDVVYPNVLEDQLREGQKALERLTSKPLVLEYEKASLTISPQELSSLVRPVGANPPGQGLLGYQVDLGRLRSMIEVWAKELEREPVDAKLSRSGLDFVLKESTIGVKVDVEATLAKVRERMGTDQRRLPLQVRLLHPRLTGAELVPVRELARRMVSEPLEIRYGQQKVMVPRERIAESITLVEETSGGRSFVRLALDEKKTLAMAEQAAEAFNRALKEGRFKLKDEKVFVLEEGQDGVQVRETETAKAIAAALLAGKHSLEPEMFVVSPSMSLPGKDRIDLSEKIIEASTSYAWSVPSKRHNIELAASRLDGTLVAPGQVFSFNKELGPTRLMDGFQMGYAIVFSGTQPITIPAEAGGICQVVTTLYHAVFWSGLRIVERWPHMYWIARYGERPLGRQGLDATVDSVSVDFKFQNNSPNWLAIRSWTEDQRVYFALFGRDPEFDVSLTGPVIERVVPADHTVVYEPHTSMKPGQQVQVESAMNGFDATITRRVTKDGVLIDEYVSKSHYSPARNVILVYPTPTPVVTPTPATTATPKPSPSVSPTPVPRFTPTAVSTPTPSPRR